VGSVFSLEFDFPFSVIEESKILPEPRETISLNGKSRTKKLEVLYVEDVESNRFLIKNLLVDYQISCQTASSGQAALRLTKKKKFDIILMDIQMPKMDGYQATEKIRKQTGGKNCKTNILAFTAEPYSEVLKTRIAKHNIQDVITKPFNTDNLIDKINSLTEPAASFFSFSFYERAFNNDRKKLRSIKKTVIKDVKHLESNLLKYHKTGNLKGIRSEIHKMRPIMKNLECLPLYEIMNKYKWPDEYTREAASTNREILKLVKRLLSKIERLKY
jgi:CheY-like chemotaxis protein